MNITRTDRKDGRDMNSTKIPSPVRETAHQTETEVQAAGTAWEEFITKGFKCKDKAEALLLRTIYPYALRHRHEVLS
jgi:hypothetical protein